MPPTTKYAKAPDGVSIAYQVFGDGPRDLVWVPGWVSHLEASWDEPTDARFFEGLGAFARLILFDKRGTGLSDRVPDAALPTLEQRISDLRTVCDAVGSQHASLMGVSEGAPMCALYAATYPERTTAIILFGGYARRLRDVDYPAGLSSEEFESWVREIVENWGSAVGLEDRAPSMAHDARFREAWARYLRLSASPAAVVALVRMNAQIDVRSILDSIRVPTLVLHRVGDRTIPIEAGRYLAEHIRGARLVELPGDDHLPMLGDSDAVLGEIEEFLTGVRHRSTHDRVLTTVLFTDIVDSTRRAAELGDRAWADLLQAHHVRVREQLARFGGREVNTAGDGFLATFDGPARAVRCGLALVERLRPIGLEIRAGVHTGEVDVGADDVRGLAVHIGARIAALAGTGEVLVSRTVKDLVAGSGLAFQARGTHVLKGVPDEWQLYAVETGSQVPAS
jgi:class 3 adenylate cyclase